MKASLEDNPFRKTYDLAANPGAPEEERLEALDRLSVMVWSKFARSANPKIQRAIELYASARGWRRLRLQRLEALWTALASRNEPQYVRIGFHWITGRNGRKKKIIPSKHLRRAQFWRWFCARARREFEEVICEEVYSRPAAQVRKTPWAYLQSYYIPGFAYRREFPIGQTFNTGDADTDCNSRSNDEKRADRYDFMTRNAISRGMLPEWIYPSFYNPLDMLIRSGRESEEDELTSARYRRASQSLQLNLYRPGLGPQETEAFNLFKTLKVQYRRLGRRQAYRMICKQMNISGAHLRVLMHRIRDKQDQFKSRVNGMGA
jgi:hypothetical protein